MLFVELLLCIFLHDIEIIHHAFSQVEVLLVFINDPLLEDSFVLEFELIFVKESELLLLLCDILWVLT